MEAKKGFLLNNDNMEDFMELSDEQAGMLIKAIFCHENGIAYEITDPVVSAVFRPIRRKLDAARETYAETVAKRKEGGAKGGAPVGNQNAKKNNQNKQNNLKVDLVVSKQPKQAKQPDTDTDTDTDTDKYIYISEPEPKTCEFVPPSVDEVRAYANEKQYAGFDADLFVAFYSSNGWKIGANPMEEWQPAVTGWHLKGKENANQLPRGKIADTTQARDLSFLEQ